MMSRGGVSEQSELSSWATIKTTKGRRSSDISVLPARDGERARAAQRTQPKRRDKENRKRKGLKYRRTEKKMQD
ncbi:hypothetical protein COCON_G00133820 [Conger conger]|uniref:Uncharacterized protein n=1 Tax=Conger conger TaxID=82655 RepID=A0A9Q1HWX2_CONCO|nr:hypothetical protein COCON_G00133820 [Conger conger]